MHAKQDCNGRFAGGKWTQKQVEELWKKRQLAAAGGSMFPKLKDVINCAYF